MQPYWEVRSFVGDQVKMRSLEWTQIQHELCPYQKGKCGHRDSWAHSEDDVKGHKENVILKPRNA